MKVLRPICDQPFPVWVRPPWVPRKSDLHSTWQEAMQQTGSNSAGVAHGRTKSGDHWPQLQTAVWAGAVVAAGFLLPTPAFSTVVSTSCPHHSIGNTALHPIRYDFSVETSLFLSFKAGLGMELEDLTNLVLFLYSVWALCLLCFISLHCLEIKNESSSSCLLLCCRNQERFHWNDTRNWFPPLCLWHFFHLSPYSLYIVALELRTVRNQGCCLLGEDWYLWDLCASSQSSQVFWLSKIMCIKICKKFYEAILGR